VLDVTFRADAARQQDRHGSANLAAIRRLVVSLLRQETTLKRSAQCKRRVCALDTNYLLKVLATAKKQCVSPGAEGFAGTQGFSIETPQQNL